VRSCLAALFGLTFFLTGHVAQAAGNELGVVLLHGKGGSPSGYVRELASALQSKGYLVSIPMMPWAQNRIYDASFQDAMGDIDREVESLRQKGAKLVVVAGHSLGANAALGYAASRSGAGAIIALAPAHSPELEVFGRRVRPDVERARALVAAGRGKERQRFSDLNQGRVMEVTASAEVYLSWLAPDGPAVMPRSAASFKAATPLLIVNGSGDRTAQGTDYIFDRAPPHAKSKFVTVAADHFSVPSAAIEEVATWLNGLLR
jgi:pimeloyl-ACP methyl ester carboxylesterase